MKKVKQIIISFIVIGLSSVFLLGEKAEAETHNYTNKVLDLAEEGKGFGYIMEEMDYTPIGQHKKYKHFDLAYKHHPIRYAQRMKDWKYCVQYVGDYDNPLRPFSPRFPWEPAEVENPKNIIDLTFVNDEDVEGEIEVWMTCVGKWEILVDQAHLWINTLNIESLPRALDENGNDVYYNPKSLSVASSKDKRVDPNYPRNQDLVFDNTSNEWEITDSDGIRIANGINYPMKNIDTLTDFCQSNTFKELPEGKYSLSNKATTFTEYNHPKWKEKAIIFHVRPPYVNMRQAVIDNKGDDLVIPKEAYYKLDNYLDPANTTPIRKYNFIASSSNMNDASKVNQTFFKKHSLFIGNKTEWYDRWVDVDPIIPEYYEYLGATVTKKDDFPKHTSNNMTHGTTDKISLDFTNDKLDYWVTTYVRPKYPDGEDAPRPYSWSLKTNKFGEKE